MSNSLIHASSRPRGQLRVTAMGEAFQFSVCHCLDCQKRTGSAFALSRLALREAAK